MKKSIFILCILTFSLFIYPFYSGMVSAKTCTPICEDSAWPLNPPIPGYQASWNFANYCTKSNCNPDNVFVSLSVANSDFRKELKPCIINRQSASCTTNYKFYYQCGGSKRAYYRETDPGDSLNQHCGSSGCSGGGFIQLGSSSSQTDFEGAVEYKTVQHGVPAIQFACWDKVSSGNYVYGGLGYFERSDIYVVSCVDDSDCSTSQFCDKSGSWDSWQCKNIPPPTVTTIDPPVIGYNHASLSGFADAHHARQLTYWFRYSTTQPASCDDSFGQSTAKQSFSITDPNKIVNFSASASLTPDTTYYHCAIADSGFGVGYGNIIKFKTLAVSSLRSDDGTKEADFTIDYSDDQAKKVINVPQTQIFKLWVYGQGYGENKTGNTSYIQINDDPNMQITFNPIDKFGRDYSWQSFNIPVGWLGEGNNSFLFFDRGSNWISNNLSLGVDTSAFGNSSGCFSDGVTKKCLDGRGGFPKGELMVYLKPPSCSGNISLTLAPSSITSGGSVIPTASGLSLCESKTINFKLGNVDVGSCQSGFSGCSAQAFTAPDSARTYTYSAFIDKNGNGNTSDAGESTSTDLIVISAAPPGGGGSPPGPTVSTCGAEGLKLLEGLLTSPPKQGKTVSQSTVESTKCIIDPKAAFAPFKIPSFDDLKSLYYTQK